MHLAHLLRSSKQRYMQFSPVLTTVGARTCTTWRFVYVLLARRCWLYPHIQFRLNFYTRVGYHCKIALITTGRDCFGCQVTAILRGIRDSHLCGPEPCVPLSVSIIWDDMNRKWIIDAHDKHWIALNSCRQSKLWIKHPKLQITKYLMFLPKKTAQSSGFSYQGAVLS
jgi:hypothetical protein